MQEARPIRSAISWGKASFLRMYGRYVGPPNVREAARSNDTTRTNLSLPAFAMGNPRLRMSRLCFSLNSFHKLFQKPAFTSAPSVFIKNLKTERAAPRSALKPAVAPSKHKPSNPRSFARPNRRPVAPMIFPLL